jgi:hypothetical protein
LVYAVTRYNQQISAQIHLEIIVPFTQPSTTHTGNPYRQPTQATNSQANESMSHLLYLK